MLTDGGVWCSPFGTTPTWHRIVRTFGGVPTSVQAYPLSRGRWLLGFSAGGPVDPLNPSGGRALVPVVVDSQLNELPSVGEGPGYPIGGGFGTTSLRVFDAHGGPGYLTLSGQTLRDAGVRSTLAFVYLDQNGVPVADPLTVRSIGAANAVVAQTEDPRIRLPIPNNVWRDLWGFVAEFGTGWQLTTTVQVGSPSGAFLPPFTATWTTDASGAGTPQVIAQGPITNAFPTDGGMVALLGSTSWDICDLQAASRTEFLADGGIARQLSLGQVALETCSLSEVHSGDVHAFCEAYAPSGSMFAQFDADGGVVRTWPWPRKYAVLKNALVIWPSASASVATWANVSTGATSTTPVPLLCADSYAPALVSDTPDTMLVVVSGASANNSLLCDSIYVARICKP